MEYNLIGSQITKFRKAARITQEELGKAVGVSTQAVSRWECGGTPDVSLLPAIADRLGVSVDALFGREGGAPRDIREAARSWFSALPREKFMDQLNRLIWSVIQLQAKEILEAQEIPYLNTARQLDSRDLVCSNMINAGGSYFGVAAEDMAYSVICTKPEQGYGAFFNRPEEYREFFSLLAKPGCLEIVLFALAQNSQYFFTVDVLAKQVDLPQESVRKILEDLVEIRWASSIAVETAAGKTDAYCFEWDGALVPFLYLAKCLSQKTGYYFLNWHTDSGPLL